MSTGGGAVEPSSSSAAAARRPSRYESQKRRDWQTFTRYLGAHRPPLQLRRCSGAHVLEFLRYLDRFGKTRVHAPPCPSYGGGGRLLAPSSAAPASEAVPACQCPLRQAWGSLDALVGRLRAAFDERHGGSARGTGNGSTSTATTNAQPAENAGGGTNPFAARAVRLYLRDVRDAQARARGISYTRKKKKRNKQQQQGQGATTCAAAKHDGAGIGCARPDGNSATTTPMAPAVPPPPHPHPTLPLPHPAYLAGLPFECCDHGSSVFGGPIANANGASGFYLPLLFNTFG